MKLIDLSGISATAGYPGLANNPNVLVGLDFLQQAYKELFAKCAQMAALSGNPTILEGLVQTGNNISAGGVYYNGEIFLCNGVTISGSPLSYIACSWIPNPTDTGSNMTVLSDSSQVSIHNQRTLAFTYSSSPNTGNLPDFNSWVPNQINLNASAIAALQNTINPLLVGAWTNLSGLYTNSWSDTGNPFNVGRYRIEGKYAVLSGNISGGGNATAAFTLPVGFRPLNRCDFETACTGSSFFSGLMTVLPTGVCTMYWPSGGPNNSLEGIRIPLD